MDWVDIDSSSKEFMNKELVCDPIQSKKISYHHILTMHNSYFNKVVRGAQVITQHDSASNETSSTLKQSRSNAKKTSDGINFNILAQSKTFGTRCVSPLVTSLFFTNIA